MRNRTQSFYFTDLTSEEIALINNYRRCSDAARRELGILISKLTKELPLPDNVVPFPQ